MIKPFWENTYLDDTVSTFGTKPNQAIEAYWKTFDKNWSILDVGCGEGKNDVFLAENGFNDVNAFDISGTGIQKLLRISFDKKLNINAWVQDLTKNDFDKQYDLIMSHGVLHFVEKEKWKEFIIKAKQNTKMNGLHILQIFTNKVPASPDIAPYVKGLADEGELESMYQDHNWEIVESKAYIFDDEHPGVEKHVHAANRIVARKIK
jgi:tellurite methyltransferase